ncbi:MAG: response regulator [Geobacteraceae bacterium]|nr:response regulator [Geobacteraceae bacterium]
MQKVLVVDDSLFQRKSICDTLKEAGFLTIEAGDGREGLETARTGSPDYILTDLLMPVMDGIQFLTELKEQGFTCPMFVLSADIQETKRKQCLDLGVAGFLSKPFKKHELIEAFSRCTSGKDV